MQTQLSQNELIAIGVKAFGAQFNPRLSDAQNLRFGRNGSKRINPQTGGFDDFEAGEGGGHVALLRLAGEQPDHWKPPERDLRRERQQQREQLQKTATAQQIWQSAQPFTGSLAERYLRDTRSIALHHIPDLDRSALRFHENCPFGDTRKPCLVAAVTNILNGNFQGVHRTALAADATKAKDVPNAKLTLGSVRGGCIRLVADADVTNGLGLAEGIETSLSVMAAGWSPVWCAVSAGGIAKFPVLAGIESLTVFADAGDAGRKAAIECGERWQSAGREVTINVAKSDDFNADMRA